MLPGLITLLLVAPPGMAQEHPLRARAGEVTVHLDPSGAVSLAQGLPFSIEARATNSSPDPVTVDILFDLSLVGGPPEHVAMWTASIQGFDSATARTSVTSSQWFEDVGAFQMHALIDGVPVSNTVAFDVLPSSVVVPVFEDVTEAAGLSTTLPGPACYRYGTGAAWGDADGDHLLDLYVPVQGGPAQLWIQGPPGQFTDQAAARGADNAGRVGMGAEFADFDRDGDQDLYVVNEGANRLYRNDGTGHFADVAPSAGVADPHSGPSASWGDYDNDGYLDLYVTNYRNCMTEGQPDLLYHNEGDGTFTDHTADLGSPEATAGVGFQAAWLDYDGDGDQDLYLANDKLGSAIPGNHLWRNDGAGPGSTWLFTDVSAESGTDWVMASMGIGISDFDRDLDLDFAVSDIQGNLLARNNGDGTFTDIAQMARVRRPFQRAGLKSITWGLGFFDFNLDGWEDLYVAAGTISTPVEQPNQLFVAESTGKFLDLSAPSHSDDGSTSRGVAFGDFDRDGRIDLYVVNQWGSPHLYRNVTPPTGQHWLEIDTVGTSSNADGCGARLTLTAGGGKMLREVFCGSISLSSGADPTVHFGLGSATSASRLTIEWPSGLRQVIRNLRADRLVTVTEPNA